MKVIPPPNRRVAKLAVAFLVVASLGALAAAAMQLLDSTPSLSPSADAEPTWGGGVPAQQVAEWAAVADGGGWRSGYGFDVPVLDGGPGRRRTGGDGLGEADDEASSGSSVADLLGPDGVYTLRDGDSEVRLRLLDPAGAVVAGAQAVNGALPGGSGSGLEELAALAGTAYVPSADATGVTQQVTPSNWLVSGSGQLFLLVGGVNVVFEPHVTETEASEILASHGVRAEHVSPLGELRGAYLVSTTSDVASLRLADALSTVPGVASAVPNLFTPMTTGADPQSYASTTASTRAACTPYTKPWPDELSACLWHLKADTDFRYRGADPTIDINLGDVWDTTMGAGVTVAIVDRTWEATHEDLRDNVDVARSKVWGGFTGENQAATHPYHGTAVAGIVGARDNAVGGRGVAPRATLLNYNLLDAFSGANEVASVTLNRESVAVYNLSYADPGFSGPFSWGTTWRQAVDEGTRHGFHGRGSSYVKSVGNGSEVSGSNWATLDEANNHRGVIAVCAVDYRGQSASYSEDGPSLWVCAPSGNGSSGPALLVPIGKNGYTRIGGTSVAAPVVSGVIALMRSANADLTWRDVKVILANTAQKNHASSSSWMSGATKYGSNTESYSFSNHYGFGTVDAQVAVQAAMNWTLLPEMLSAEATSSTVVALPSQSHEIELSLDVDSGDMDFIEHVSISLTGDIYDLRDYEWTLVSPTGAESLLAPRATECREGACSLSGTFHFGSSRHLGEDPSGAWKLKVRKYAHDITHCVSDSDSYYRFYGIAQFCRKYRSYDQTISAVQIVVTGHSSAAVSLQPVKVSVSPSRVTEGAEVEVSVTIEGAAPTQDVVIPLEITAGTATAAGLSGADYAVLASITVPAGASSASARLATVADDADESDETFTVGLGTLPPGYRPVTGMPKVTIVDDDSPPTVTLHASSPSVAEGDFVMITASLSHPSSQDVILDVSAAAVAPAVPADGSMSAWTKLTIVAGTTASADPVAFIASQNDVDEPPKVFRIAATAAGGDVADPSAITVTIDDDTQPVVRPADGNRPAPTVRIVADGNVIEGDAASFTLVANPRPTAPLSVSVMSSLWTKYPLYQGNQGITAGARAVTIPVTGSAKLTFVTTDDDDWGADLELTATLQTGSGYAVSSTAQADVVVVMDDDHSGGTAVGTVSVGASGDTIVEGEDASFTITFDRPAIKGFGDVLPVRVRWSFDGDFADDSARTATFIPGKRELTKTFSVGTLDDGSVEAGGSVTLELLPFWDLGYDLYYSVGTPARATISIVDNDGDLPEVSITAGADVTEGAAATFTVSRGSVGSAALAVDVTVSDSGDFAAAGQVGSRRVTINAGETSATLTVATSDDSTDEADGSVTATLVDGADYDLGPLKTATVSVADDDPGLDYTDYQTVVDYLIQVRDNPVNTAVRGNPVHIRKWNRVLAAIGHDSGELAMPASEIHDNAAKWPDSPFHAASVYLNSQQQQVQQKPEITVTAGSGVTEGASLTFTLSASPAPVTDLAVSVTVTQSGDYAAATGQQTVTIPTTGSTTFTIATTDDTTDETDGSVTATVDAGSDYTVSATQGTATVAVSDNDDPTQEQTGYTVDPAVAAKVQALAAQTQHGTAHVNRWNRVLVAFGEHDGTGVTGGVMTAAEAQQMANTHSSPVWDEVVTELTALEASAQSTPPPPPPSEVNITAAVDGTEGTSVSFTLTATPAPSADLPVSVTVSVVGDYGVTAGSQTLTIPTSGSTTFTVATTDDDADEPDGSVTLTVNAGSDYTVGALSSETATVADDDPVQEQPQMPVVTITAGSGVTEGGSVEFTVSASSVPAADLDVTVTVTAVGDYGVTADTRTVTIPTSGSAILTVATAGDDADEPDGSVTATLVDGADYDLGTPNTVTVTVVDDDPSPPLPPDTDEPDQPDDAVLTACADRPTLLISSPEASRSDATVDFEVSLSCIPSGSPMILLTPVRDGNIGENMFVALSSEQTSATVTVTIGSEDQLGLALAWNTGLANRKAQGDVTYTD